MDVYVGIDIGGSRIKVGAFSARGEGLALAIREYSAETPRRGWVQLDPSVWWEHICSALAECWNSVDPRDVRGIGSSATNATLAVDAEGNVVLPAVFFTDQRALGQTKWLLEEVGQQRFFQLTANRLMSGPTSLPLLLFLKQEHPDDYETIRWILHPSSYVTFKLTGQAAIDPSRACLSLLLDYRTGDWSEELMGELDLRRSIFPPVVAPDQVVGTVTAPAHESTGLPVGCAVVAGGNDTACAALGSGAIAPGQIVDNSGTAAILLAVTDKPLPNEHLITMPHVLKDRWLSVAPMTSFGTAMSWFRDQLAQPEVRRARRDGTDVYELLMALAQESRPGANGLLFLPYLQGERSPLWDPDSRGVFFGLAPHHRRQDMLRAVVESAGFGLRWNLEIMHSLGICGDEVAAMGGHARSRFLIQLKSDISGAKFLMRPTTEASARGAALLAAEGVGDVGNLHSVAQAGRDTEDVLLPCSETTELYDQLFNLYKRIYFSLKEPFQQLANIVR